jgi:hypothetical protein
LKLCHFKEFTIITDVQGSQTLNAVKTRLQNAGTGSTQSVRTQIKLHAGCAFVAGKTKQQIPVHKNERKKEEMLYVIDIPKHASDKKSRTHFRASGDNLHEDMTR